MAGQEFGGHGLAEGGVAGGLQSGRGRPAGLLLEFVDGGHRPASSASSRERIDRVPNICGILGSNRDASKFRVVRAVRALPG